MTKAPPTRLGDHSEGTKWDGLVKALEQGERSGSIEDFDRNEFLQGLHRRMKEFGMVDFKEGTTAFVEKRKANFTGA